jgi:hypothetical protein
MSGRNGLPGADGFHRVRNIHAPFLTVFRPPRGKAAGVAFVICPGGGNNYLVMDLEGASVARRLNDMGVAAFILESRRANTPGYHYKAEVHSLDPTVAYRWSNPDLIRGFDL